MDGEERRQQQAERREADAGEDDQRQERGERQRWGQPGRQRRQRVTEADQTAQVVPAPARLLPQTRRRGDHHGWVEGCPAPPPVLAWSGRFFAAGLRVRAVMAKISTPSL